MKEKAGGYFSPFILAMARADFPERDDTIALLQEAFEVQDPMVPFINNWVLAPVADDPRYQALLDALNLPNLFRADGTWATSVSEAPEHVLG